MQNNADVFDLLYDVLQGRHVAGIAGARGLAHLREARLHAGSQVAEPPIISNERTQQKAQSECCAK
jgi:hypothetical protein